jgi:hypothetical protein
MLLRKASSKHIIAGPFESPHHGCYGGRLFPSISSLDSSNLHARVALEEGFFQAYQEGLDPSDHVSLHTVMEQNTLGPTSHSLVNTGYREWVAKYVATEKEYEGMKNRCTAGAETQRMSNATPFGFFYI